MKKDWEVKKLEEVCDVLNGGTPDTKKKEFWDGKILWITPKDMGKLKTMYVYDTERKITEVGLKNSSAKILPANSVVLSSRAPIGHLAINTKPISTNQGCKGLVPKYNLNAKYLFYFLRKSVQLLNDLGSGTTFKELSSSKLLDVKIPIPPLHEQQRIVSVLDKCFTAIDKVKTNAEQNLKNTKELFESYLQGVFKSGKDWEVRKLEELTTILGDGLHGTPKYTVDGDYYFINGNNLNDGKIEFKENTKRVNINEFIKHRKNLNDRTVLVSINGTLGNVAYYNNEKIILGKSACYFNLKENVDKAFIKNLICSPYFIKYAHREATGATIKNVSLKSMRNFLVPLPPLQTQQSIVRQLDTLKAQIQKLETVYNKKLLDLEELKSSILQEAFRGKLTAEAINE